MFYWKINGAFFHISESKTQISYTMTLKKNKSNTEN